MSPVQRATRNDNVAQRLIQHLNNPEKGVVHHCFAYAWATVKGAGGKDINSAPQDKSCRGQDIGSLDSMVKSGKINVGDVVYCCKAPGTDPASTNLANGPHWFTYIGNGKFADQYGVKTGAEMAQFVPGRKIDTVYHCFEGKPADPPKDMTDNLGGDSSSVGGGGSPSGMSLGGGGSAGGAGGASSGGGASSYGGGGSASGSSSGGASAADGASSGGPVGPMPSGDLAQWIEEAIKILEQMGIPADKIDKRAIAAIIQHESGGNPHAINNWDSNAAAGHPSKGLMQTIDSTFNAYKAPGHGDIYNPVDNIVAGVRYALSRYGSMDNVPGIKAMASGGKYVGY